MNRDEFIDAARFRASILWPWTALGLWSLRGPVWVEDMPGGSIGVDKDWCLYVHPDVVEKVSVDTMATMIQHEVWHCLRDHMERGKVIPESQLKRWNWAADAEVNGDLKWVDKPPYEIVTPEFIGMNPGLSAEQYYAGLPEVKETILVYGTSGSCSDGHPRPWEVPRRAMNPLVADSIRKHVASEIMCAPGRAPAGMRRWAESCLKTNKVPWQQELSAMIKKHVAPKMGQMDYSRSRPSRRQLITPVLLQTMRGFEPTVDVILDTSGSMSEKTLGLVLSEVNGILRAVRGRVRVMSCDTKVSGVQIVNNVSNIELSGGGGTDMGAGIEYAVGLKPRADVIIVLTDGGTSWPSEAPCVPVVIGIIDKCYFQRPPSWAKVIDIESKK